MGREAEKENRELRNIIEENANRKPETPAKGGFKVYRCECEFETVNEQEALKHHDTTDHILRVEKKNQKQHRETIKQRFHDAFPATKTRSELIHDLRQLFELGADYREAQEILITAGFTFRTRRALLSDALDTSTLDPRSEKTKEEMAMHRKIHAAGKVNSDVRDIRD